MISSILTVTQVNVFIKSLIEGDGRLQDVFITGEISNFTDHYKSGHMYFSLKDNQSVIKSVMFQSYARRLKFLPQNGMRVVIRGRVSVYEATGQYQIYAEDMQPDGVGAIALAFEQLKEKLLQKGLFEGEFKKPLPTYPMKIDVITSSSGAAVRDILQILERRWPIANVRVHSVLVQGEGAAGQITTALKACDNEAGSDVIIIARGGGSMEDLWAFNDETLAYAIFESRTPVVSAIGHETDFTICDFVSDLRAPTPSAAAELCTPDIKEEKAKLYRLNSYFIIEAQSRIEYERHHVYRMIHQELIPAASNKVFTLRDTISSSQNRCGVAIRQKLSREQNIWTSLNSKLDTLSPLKVLARGYAAAFQEDGTLVSSVTNTKKGDKLQIHLHDGTIFVKVL